MSQFRVKASSTLPLASADWKVDLGDDPANAMLYTNMAYSLVAAAMAKLGVEMSKYMLCGDKECFDKAMEEAHHALKSGTTN